MRIYCCIWTKHYDHLPNMQPHNATKSVDWQFGWVIWFIFVFFCIAFVLFCLNGGTVAEQLTVRRSWHSSASWHFHFISWRFPLGTPYLTLQMGLVDCTHKCCGSGVNIHLIYVIFFTLVCKITTKHLTFTLDNNHIIEYAVIESSQIFTLANFPDCHRSFKTRCSLCYLVKQVQ